MLRIERSDEKGRYVVAATNIPENTYLGMFYGPRMLFPINDGIIDYRNVDPGFVLDIYKTDVALYGMVVGLDLIRSIDFINHSCVPNCRVDGPHKLAVVSSRMIAEGEELHLDYRTFTLAPVGIKCWCSVPEHMKCII